MAAQLFYLNDFVRKDEKFHLARVTIRSRQDLSLHKHDYAEIFWVENGKGFHFINGQKVGLKTGDLVMIRPDDEHNFTSSKGLTIMNLAFWTETLDVLRTRYFPDSESYFWGNQELPYVTSLNQDVIKLISQKSQKATNRKSLLELDELLIFIFKHIESNQEIKISESMPDWLVKGIHSFSSPDNLKLGAKGFAAICDKNVDHVNRVVKRHLGKTLTNLVTEVRMNLASKQLTFTNSPIKNICNDCGFENLGHFYAIFKQTFGQTPGQYRKMNQRIC